MKDIEPFPRIGLIANPDKPLCPAVVGAAARLVLDTGRVLVADRVTASLLQVPHETQESTLEAAHHSDLLLVFGGDGTMLRVARETANSRKPILGINIGGLGFLTAVSSQKLGDALALVWAKHYNLENRHLICATGTVISGILDQLALNDFVFGRSNTSRMIELEVSVDGQVLTRYRCDGLIVSSPTGSTAYSLSAGGAVVCPNAEVLTITPICPHTLSNRSVIVSLNSCVQVKVISHKLETVLTADGQVQTNLAAGDVVTVKRSRSAVCLMHLTGSSFFETLRQKLNWSGSNIQL